jgi:hypothetical protein
MRVRINIGLDFDGVHTFDWQPSDAPGAIEVPRATLERWTAEREGFSVAYLRYKRVMEEVEDVLYRAEQKRAQPEAALALAHAIAGKRSIK